ncbi:cyclophane-forming radical SAM/SPASM peptide maturase YhhB [Pseudofrankia sp. BMG5.36]|uniref:cyclophane-forming radical SAM/SPASM peptide maturase YhhB n=1 Tax=Pseudofrankia sp. BMG5.36 TaxID=1834512 RepID=UPI0009F240CC|nr:cyclophane-forming radical SAM/SPASM peptide maturase YhhB [Pseudofrankia sp. BMG5.36]
MSAEIAGRKITSLLVKVASRCNLACDYCYIYEHADQSWRHQPRLISYETTDLLARRLAEYVERVAVPRMSVIFHGGEPLLLGVPRLVELAKRIRAAVAPATRIDIGLQTNGVLLDEEALTAFGKAEIGVSLSLDGPSEVHDRHRPLRNGKPSHAGVMNALRLLRTRPDVFLGVIAVIDPEASPQDTVRWFGAQGIPALDLLLPDANHATPPPGRDRELGIYADWLTHAFDTWFDEFPQLRLRTFDALLASLCGLPSSTDAFGIGDVSLLTVETDGGWHDLDVLKTTYDGRTRLDLSLATAGIAEAAESPTIQQHAFLLSPEGLSAQCRSCPEMTVCGGGAVAHRYRPGSGSGGFANPTVYCREMLGLITHARARLIATVNDEQAALRTEPYSGIDWDEIDAPSAEGRGELERILAAWRETSYRRLADAVAAAGPEDKSASRLRLAGPEVKRAVATYASTQLWLRIREADAEGRPLRALDGTVLTSEQLGFDDIAGLVDLEPRTEPALHREDRLLQMPFGPPIEFLPASAAEADDHRVNLRRSLAVVGAYSPAMLAELTRLCCDIQLIRDLSADPDKSVSFSDDTVPGGLYISPPARWDAAALFDVADSLIHEYRHQKLYLIGRSISLVSVDRPLVRSPWREEPRPPSGLLHAVFVFVELLSFWAWAVDGGAPEKLRERAQENTSAILARLADGFETLQACRLTPQGRDLCDLLYHRYTEYARRPGR